MPCTVGFRNLGGGDLGDNSFRELARRTALRRLPFPLRQRRTSGTLETDLRANDTDGGTETAAGLIHAADERAVSGGSVVRRLQRAMPNVGTLRRSGPGYSNALSRPR